MTPPALREVTTLWTELTRSNPDPAAVEAARTALRSDPPFAVCLEVLAHFPRYVGTAGDSLVWEFIVENGSRLDETVLARIGGVFVMLWQRKPRNRFWYGDLRQSFVPHDIQLRLASVSAVEDQLLDDLRTLAAAQRAHPSDLACRRLERACELLLHAPSERCRATLAPIVALDYLGPQDTRRLPSHYEPVYWGMLRILRKVGELI